MTPVDNLWITLWITGLKLWITLWITCGKLRGLTPVDNPPFIHRLSTGRGQLSTAVIHSPFLVLEGVFPRLSTFPQALLLRLRIF